MRAHVLTYVGGGPEDGGMVERGAIPTAMRELVLTLAYRLAGGERDGQHVVPVQLAQPHLAGGQAGQHCAGHGAHPVALIAARQHLRLAQPTHAAATTTHRYLFTIGIRHFDNILQNEFHHL